MVVLVDRIILNEVNPVTSDICACIGYFDGLHLGHQALVNRTIERAKYFGCESALITFDPDPWVTIKGVQDVPHLTSMEHRIKLAEKMGIDRVIILDFTKEMSQLSPVDFMNKILVPCRIKALICGFDFHFGGFGKGDGNFLKENAPFEVDIIDCVAEDALKISSTRISELITKGAVGKANSLLGYQYTIDGEVIHGKGKGHDMGFPTANISLNKEYILPKQGVYAGCVELDGEMYKAMINIGHNPTFNYRTNISIEAFILNFNRDIYDAKVKVSFVEYIRDEQKYENMEALVEQLKKDVRTTDEVVKL